MAKPDERSREIIGWECPVTWNCDRRVDTFIDEGGADELVVECSVGGCEFTEIYVREPEPYEMACKVIGSTCVNIRLSDEQPGRSVSRSGPSPTNVPGARLSPESQRQLREELEDIRRAEFEDAAGADTYYLGARQQP